MTGRRRGPPQLLGAPRSAYPGRQAVVHLHRASLGKHVDHGIAVRAQSQPGAGITQGNAGTDPVGEPGLRGRTEADVRAGGAQGCDVVGGQLGGVHGRCAGGPHAGAGEQFDRGRSRDRETFDVLGGLFGNMDVKGCARKGGRDGGQLIAGDGTYGMDRRADHDVIIILVQLDERLHAGRPRIGVAIAESALNPFQRNCTLQAKRNTRRQIAGVQQRDPQVGLAGSRDERLCHRIGFVIRLSVGLVVHVVEFADGADAGEVHLGVRGTGEVEQ